MQSESRIRQSACYLQLHQTSRCTALSNHRVYVRIALRWYPLPYSSWGRRNLARNKGRGRKRRDYNDSIMPSYSSRPSVQKEEPGVYASLSDLVALQFKARGFSFLPRQPVHSLLAGRHASRLRGRGLNFEEIRRYLPGDDIRQIDWKVTVAHAQDAQSRLYRGTRAQRASARGSADHHVLRQREEHEVGHRRRSCGARCVARPLAKGPHRRDCFQ